MFGQEELPIAELCFFKKSYAPARKISWIGRLDARMDGFEMGAVRPKWTTGQELEALAFDQRADTQWIESPGIRKIPKTDVEWAGIGKRHLTNLPIRAGAVTSKMK